MRVAISWFTLDTPESFPGGVSVEMMSGGVACRRTFLDLIDARKLKMNNHMDGGKEGGYLSLFSPLLRERKTEFSAICRVQPF
jgi:hypothetical protein